MKCSGFVLAHITTLFLLCVLSLGVILLCAILVIELTLLFPVDSLQTIKGQFLESRGLNELIFSTELVHKPDFYAYALLNHWPFWLNVLLGASLSYIMSRIMLQHRATKNYMARIHMLEKEVAQTAHELNSEQGAHSAMLKRVEALYNHSPESYLLVNSNGNIEHINPAADRFFKTLHGEDSTCLNRRIHDVLPSFAETGLARLFDQIVGKEAVWQGELQLHDTSIWLNLKIIHAGEKGVIFILRNISHEHTDDIEMRNSSMLTQSILANAPQAMAILDKDFIIQKATPAFTALCDSRSVQGQDITDLLPLSEWPEIKHALEAESTFSRPEEKIIVNQSEKWISWQAKSWQNINGSTGGYIFFISDSTELHNTRNRAQSKETEEHAMAYQDALTGLPNRQLFNDRLNMALAQAYRQLGKLAILFLDLDGFKAVNDTLGHDAGDILLKEVSNRLQKTVRDTDTVARLGGDEFTIILNIREPKDANIVAQKIINTINKPYDLSGKEGHVSTSIGIALYPLHGNGANELMKRADTAMYAAKTSGKNQFVYYSDALESEH